MTNPTDERAAFEAAMRDQGMDVSYWIEGKPEHGYENSRVADYWFGWQARACLAGQAAAPEGAEAEFELHCNGELSSAASGPREQAWAEIQRYAAQYAQDGEVTIYEVTRRIATPPGAAPARAPVAEHPCVNECAEASCGRARCVDDYCHRERAALASAPTGAQVAGGGVHPCGHLRGSCQQCHQCLIDAGKTACPVCEPQGAAVARMLTTDEILRALVNELRAGVKHAPNEIIQIAFCEVNGITLRTATAPTTQEPK